jgi:anti-sigma regulatory factor (Ser/Thr protein kinase)
VTRVGLNLNRPVFLPVFLPRFGPEAESPALFLARRAGVEPPARACRAFPPLMVEEDMVMAKGVRFEFLVVDDPSAGTRLRAELRQWLHLAGASGATSNEIVSAVTEAFDNAVKHPVEPANGQVGVEGELSGRDVVFRVRDQGRWNETVDPTRGHYGYQLMEAQMDSVEVERGVAGTVVTLQRTI